MLDINSGLIEKKRNMNFNRQAHGMAKIGDYVYCSAGISNRVRIESTFERYSLTSNTWENLPSLEMRKFSHNMLAIDNRFLYTLGGISPDLEEQHMRNCVEIERFDTLTIPLGPESIENRWTRYILKTENNIESCC